MIKRDGIRPEHSNSGPLFIPAEFPRTGFAVNWVAENLGSRKLGE
jgi:hypothetical protein